MITPDNTLTDTMRVNKPAAELRNNVYFTQLDGLRCLAVLSVIISHFVTYRAYGV